MSIRKPFALPPLLALTLICLWGASSASAAVRNDKLEVRTANPSVAVGSKDLIGGKLLTSSGQPIHNGTVYIEYAYPGEHFQQITQFKTTGVGSYYHLYTVPATVYFRAHFTGGGGYDPLTTSYVKVNTTQAVPANGTEYVDPKTGCIYEVQNRQWVGVACESQQVNSSGAPIPNLFNLYEFNPSSSNHVGNYLMELYTGNSQYNEIREPNSVVFQVASWLGIPKSNPAAEALWEVNLGGTETWIDTTEFRQVMEAEQAAKAGQQAAPPASETIAVPNTWSTTVFGDFFNGIDNLSGNAELGAVASSVYSLGISEPFDASPCGTYGLYCIP